MLSAENRVATDNTKRKRKDHAFQRQFDEKPSIIPGCPVQHRAAQCNRQKPSATDKSPVQQTKPMAANAMSDILQESSTWLCLRLAVDRCICEKARVNPSHSFYANTGFICYYVMT